MQEMQDEGADGNAPHLTESKGPSIAFPSLERREGSAVIPGERSDLSFGALWG